MKQTKQGNVCTAESKILGHPLGTLSFPRSCIVEYCTTFVTAYAIAVVGIFLERFHSFLAILFTMYATLKAWAKRIRQDTVMLWFARRHPCTPLIAKLLCVLTVAYALSPIDLIPDFVPVLGLLDELIVLPAMIWLAVRMLPGQVVDACRQQANEWFNEHKGKPRSYVGAVVIVLLWIGILFALWRWLGQ